MNPLFSIITVSYNAEATIGRTLDSIDAQTFNDYEHLIVDGASTDGTCDIVKRTDNPARRMISEPDKGLYDAMNKGISRTTGHYLIFLNAGDKFHSADTLATIAAAIEKHNYPGVVYGQTNIVDNEGRTIGPRHLTAPDKLTLASFADGMLVCHQAFVALRRICGSYDLRYRFSADYEWCIRCLQHSRRNKGLTDTVFIDYLSEGITSSNKIASLLERFRIMAYYYGWIPTVLRHVRFAFRALKRKSI